MQTVHNHPGVAACWADIPGMSPRVVAGYGLGSSFGSSQPPSWSDRDGRGALTGHPAIGVPGRIRSGRGGRSLSGDARGIWGCLASRWLPVVAEVV
jgi:hypothetical protein